MGNPTLYLSIYQTDATVVIVYFNPSRRDRLPFGSTDILNRISPIDVGSSLPSELRAFEFVHSSIEMGTISPDPMKDLRIHSMRDDADAPVRGRDRAHLEP